MAEKCKIDNVETRFMADLIRLQKLIDECERAHADFDFWMRWGWAFLFATLATWAVAVFLGATGSPYFWVAAAVNGIFALVMFLLFLPRDAALDRSSKAIEEIDKILER